MIIMVCYQCKLILAGPSIDFRFHGKRNLPKRGQSANQHLIIHIEWTFFK